MQQRDLRRRLEAEHRGVSLSPHTLSRWVNNGRADLSARKTGTSYGRFAQIYDERREKFCGPAANRIKQLEAALASLEKEREQD